MTKANRLLPIPIFLILASMISLWIIFWKSPNGYEEFAKKEELIKKLKEENKKLQSNVDSLKISLEVSGFVIDKYETCVMLLEEESKDCWIKFDSIYKNHE